jgi:DNA polymerase-4
VKVKFEDFQQITRSRSQPGPVTTCDTLCRTSFELVRSIFPPAKGIRLVGVTVSNFVEVADAAEPALPMFAESRAA